MSGDPFDGRGRQHGPLRPDWGPGWAELACDRCGASWVGPPGEPCDWCRRAHERLLERQAELLLSPALPDPDDITYPSALSAWTERLARGSAAGVVDERRARQALERRCPPKTRSSTSTDCSEPCAPSPTSPTLSAT